MLKKIKNNLSKSKPTTRSTRPKIKKIFQNLFVEEIKSYIKSLFWDLFLELFLTQVLLTIDLPEHAAYLMYGYRAYAIIKAVFRTLSIIKAEKW